MYNFYNTINNEFVDNETINEYFKKLKNGDYSYRDKIIENYLLLVAKIAKSFKTKYNEEDLINEGMIGLIKAVDSFQIEKRIKFFTFAKKCIENEIGSYLRKQIKYCKEICVEEIFESENKKILFQKTTDLFELYEQKEIKIIVGQILENLNDKERYIIESFLGLNNKEKKSQTKIAEQLNLSQSYISKTIKCSLNKLRQNPESKKIILTLYK